MVGVHVAGTGFWLDVGKGAATVLGWAGKRTVAVGGEATGRELLPQAVKRLKKMNAVLILGK
jgi:hypothetical protein